MIDIETHKIIDLINSRDLEDVKEWLSTYKNLKLVSRDGSIIYKKAISESHPNALQVSDRFHLLKNLTDYCKEYLKQKFEINIIIEEKNKIIKKEDKINYVNNKYLTLEKKIEISKVLLKQNMSKTSICKKLNMDIRTFNKLIKMTKKEIIEYFKSNIKIRKEEKTNKKMDLVNLVRKLYSENYTKKKYQKN